MRTENKWDIHYKLTRSSCQFPVTEIKIKTQEFFDSGSLIPSDDNSVRAVSIERSMTADNLRPRNCGGLATNRGPPFYLCNNDHLKVHSLVHVRLTEGINPRFSAFEGTEKRVS